ncbi:MAG TPA: hypothetical protein VH186_11085 [Chloroflexia bacterium]|nr:hypothetical protein [Chloroflexia bacterium]
MLNTFEIPSPYPAQVGTGKVITRQKVLFVCSSNASLSQLGAAFFRYFDPESSRFEVYSAGSGPRVANRLHPLAAAMIEELGQDSNKIRPKALSEFCNTTFDYVFIVGVEANSAYQAGKLSLPETKRVLVWPFPDPALISPYLQPHYFQQVGDSMYQLVRNLLKLPNFAGAQIPQPIH